jgi:hypothetical protein
MSNISETVKIFNTVVSFQNMDTEYISKAKDLFEEYKKHGIIIDCNFSDTKWKLSDEYSNVGIVFNINKFSYKRYYEDYFDITYEFFVDYLKTYVVLTMGNLALKSLQNLVNDIKRIIKYNPKDFNDITKNIKLTHSNRVIEFFSVLPETDNSEMIEDLIDILEEISDINNFSSKGFKRPLASFDSYFLFNDIINDYWKSEISEDERLFFYPLFLWWQISGVVPLRPREFILTPRNCIEKRDDGFYLTLRKNSIKGSDKKISYKIDTDYYTVQYKIPDNLAEEILKYLDFTKKYESTELNTLFITDTHYQKWNKKKFSNNRYFTYVNMNCVMRYFFNEIIENKYGLKITYDRTSKHLQDGFINYLYLGDTRHLALINIIAEGGNPVIAMMLAGHENIEMSAHYYSNITSLIECRTYKQYRRILKGNVTYEISRKEKLSLNIKDFTLLDDGGKCYSEAFKNNCFSDCKKISGPEGEIGYCPNCTFYRKASLKNFLRSDNIYKRKIEDDCTHLAQVVKRVRIQKGNSEDILQAILRLQNSSYSYQQYYEEKMLKEKEKENGTKGKN